MKYFDAVLNGLAIIAVCVVAVGIALATNHSGRCENCGGPTFDRPGTSYHECLLCKRVFNPGESGKPIE